MAQQTQSRLLNAERLANLIEVVLCFVKQRFLKVIPKEQKFWQVAAPELRQVGRSNINGLDQNGLPHREKTLSAPFAQNQRAAHQQHHYQHQQCECEEKNRHGLHNSQCGCISNEGEDQVVRRSSYTRFPAGARPQRMTSPNGYSSNDDQ